MDSQIMTDFLLSNGFRLASASGDVDVLLVNTCSFIRDARREAEQAIRRACRLKKLGHCRAVVVAGCLSQRLGPELLWRFPEVDALLGVDELDQIVRICRDVLRGKRSIVEISPSLPHRLFESSNPRAVLSRGPYTYLRIAEGCGHACSFCVIPHIRGPYRSRRLDRIVREAEWLLSRGFRELNVVAQDSTAYGTDCEDGASLPVLLRRLGRLGGKFWIRVLYGYPARVTEDLLAAMAEVPQVCHYLDIPIQHSHSAVLQAMGRADTVEFIPKLAERVRRVLPDVTLRTTCITGFPGETRERFEHLLRFARETEFDHVGVFVFSPEEGTPAFGLRPRPSSREAERRRERLLALQRQIVEQKAHRRVGEKCEVLLEKPAPQGSGTWLARSYREAPEVDGLIRVRNVAPGLRAGDFIRVRLTASRGYDMDAVDESSA